MNGNPKPVDQQRDWGYTIGGPIGHPGGDNKLFFFYSQEFRPRTAGGNTSNIRVPTALERQGDFSQTLDNQGNLFNRIYNPYSGLPRSRCSATGTDVAACFADGGVLGRIPRNLLYGPGIALLNMYPLPSLQQAQGTSFNYQNLDPVRHTMGYTPNIKVDYQVSNDLRASWKINMASARVVPTPGNLPGLTDNVQKFPTSFNTAWAVNYTITPTTFLEASYGVNQNRLGNVPIGPLANRNNVVCPSDLAGQIANCTMGGLALLFPDAGVIDERTYQYQALSEVGTPILDGTRIVMSPQIGWGNTRIGSAPPTVSYPGFLNLNRIQQFSVSLTKVVGRHTAKAGLYIEHSFKAQNQNNQFQGNLSFGVDNNNTIDSQYPFANAALGIFTSYTQQSRMVEGNFYYNNIEWFLQDNWKLTPRLTLDYGVRIAHDGPYIDNFRQVANFFEDRWSLANAPMLYQPGCVGASPCSGNNRQARDPRTGQLLGPGSSGLIGAMVIGTGDPANGMVLAGDGIHKAGYTWPSIAVGPRFGAAYDLTGDQTTVFRGSVGLYFDRPDGNVAFGTVGNPPTGGSLTQQWGYLADIANPVLAFGPVPNLTMNLYDSAIPKDFQWNAEVQRALPWASSVSVAYAGHHAFDVLGGQQNGNPVNLNTIDLGTTLTPAGIDPTTGTALNNNLLRPFRGYGNINIQWARFYRNYHSIQSAFTRRFRDNFQFGVSHTWTLRDFGNVGLQDVQLRINHNPDASWYIRDDQAEAEKLFGNQGTTTHIVKGNFIYDLPDMNPAGGFLRAVSLLANDWQVAGVVSIDSGGKYDLGYSYNTGPSGQALTGSPNYNARIVLNNLSALGSGCSDNQFAQFDNTMVAATGGVSPVMTPALSGPQVGSVGLESGRDYLTGCPDHMVDLAIQRTIRLGGGRRLDIRFDVFNAFNQVIYTGRQSTLQLNSVTDQTVRNSQFLADGTMDPNRTRPNSAGFGAVTGAATLRNIQLQVRFGF
jgi:hypothetical protein